MKNLTIFALFLSFFITSCGGQTAKKADNIVTKKEKQTKTIALTQADFLTKVDDFVAHPKEWKYLGDKPALIDFYASWCGPCKMIAPILEDLAVEYEGQIVIYKVDAEAEIELADHFGVNSYPNLLFIPMAGEPQMIRGAMSKAAFKKAIDSILLKK